MANEFFTHLTKVDMDATGLKKGVRDIEAMEAKLKKLGISTAKVTGVGDPMIKSISKQGRVMTTTTQKFATMDKQNHTLVQSTGAVTQKMGDFQKALRRVAIVVPIWLLFRTAMMSVFRTISEGTKYWIEFDKAFTKASLVVHTQSKDMSKVLNTLREDMLQLARDTGVSANKIADAFYRFGTLGIDVEQAWAGAEAVVRASVATFGDAGQMARSTALAISLMGDTLEQNLSIQERTNLFMAKQVALWKSNLMEANEFAGAIERFMPVANAYNFTLDETIALLATLHSGGIRSTRAGRLLSTQIMRLTDNLGHLGKSLGIYINPELEGTWDIMLKVTKAFHDMAGESGNVTPQMEAMLGKIFGGVRARQVGLTLSNMHELLKVNKDLIDTMGGTDAEKMNWLNENMAEQIEKVTDAVFKAKERFKELKNQVAMGVVKGFAEGITNTDNFADAINKLNELLEELNENAERVTRTLSHYGIGVLTPGYLGLTEEIIHNIRRITKEAENSALAIEEIAKKGYTVAGRTSPTPAVGEKTVLGTEGRITGETRERLTLLAKEVDYIEMEMIGFNKMEIAYEKLNNLLTERVIQQNKIAEDSKGMLKPLSQHEAVTLALNKNWDELAKKLHLMPQDEADLMKVAKQVNKVYQERLKLIDNYSSQLEKVTQDMFKAMLKGEASLEDLGTKLTDMWSQAISKKLTVEVSKTGVFGDLGKMFAEMEQGIEGQMEAGGVSAGTTIKRDMIDASIIAGRNIAQALAVPGPGGGLITGTPAGGGGWLGQGKPGIPGGGYPGGYAPAGYTDPTKTPSTFSKMGGWSGVASTGLGAYAGYQSGGTRGAVGGAMMGLGSAMLAVNPILGGLMMLGSMFMGSKKKSVTTSSWQAEQAPENIPLQIAGGIAPLPNKYALPESRYFAGRQRGITDKGVSITIKIDKIEGTNEEIAGKIADKVADIYNRQLERGLNVTYP